MRIAGSINDPYMKITVMDLNQKLAVKFEYNLLEQTVKFHLDCTAENIQKIEALLTVPYRQEIMSRFAQMGKMRKEMHDGMEE